MAPIWRQAISGRLAVTASGSAFTASPMIPISRRIADTAMSECSPLKDGR